MWSLRKGPEWRKVCVLSGFYTQSESSHWILTPFSSAKGPKGWVVGEKKRNGEAFLWPLTGVIGTIFQLCLASVLFLWHNTAVTITTERKPTWALVALVAILLQGHVCLKFVLWFLEISPNLSPCLSCCGHLSGDGSVSLTVLVIIVWQFSTSFLSPRFILCH